MSEKIRPHHLQRKAILYVRQSSQYQVLHNLESQKLQYAMQEHVRRLGWQEIEVIDEDLGRSAAGTTTRAGFERMVAEVCLGKSARSPRARFPASPATAETGSSSSRSVALWTPCSSTRRWSTRRARAMIACCWDSREA
jgi:hypothetical protein